jgi:hypothetical protein
LINMAPEVGLEPTTLRLTAVEAGVLAVTIFHYKLLLIRYLQTLVDDVLYHSCYPVWHRFENRNGTNPPHFPACKLRPIPLRSSSIGANYNGLILSLGRLVDLTKCGNFRSCWPRCPAPVPILLPLSPSPPIVMRF